MAGPVRKTMNFALKLILAGVLLGILVAVLRVFDWDIFALVDWIWERITGFINAIADWLTGNKNFQQVVSAP